MRAWWTPALLCLAAAFEGRWISSEYLARRGTLGWDEATHATAALLLTRDLQDGSLAAFVTDSYRMVNYPFADAWWRTPFLLVADTADMARLPSLLAFLGTAAAAALLARRLAPDAARTPAGLLAAFLVLTSPLPAYLSTLALLESLGAMVTLLALLAYLPVIEREDPHSGVRTGLLVLVAFLTKQNYGIFLLLTFSLCGGWRFFKQAGRLNSVAGHVVLMMVATAGLAIWFAVPLAPRVAVFFQVARASVDYAGSQSAWTSAHLWTSLSYYGRAVLTVPAGSSAIGFPIASGGLYLPSLLMSVVLLLSLLWRFRQRPSAAVLACLTYVAIVFMIMTVHPNKQDRFIITAMPVLFAIGAASVGALLIPAPAAASGRLWLLRAGMGIAVLSNGVLFPGGLAAVADGDGLGRMPSVEPALRFIDLHANNASPLLLVGSFNELSPGILEWRFLHTRTRAAWPQVLMPPRLPAAGVNAADINHQAAIRLREAAGQTSGARFVALELADDAPLRSAHNNDYALHNAWQLPYITALATMQDLTIVAEEYFPELQLTARIYRQNQERIRGDR